MKNSFTLFYHSWTQFSAMFETLITAKSLLDFWKTPEYLLWGHSSAWGTQLLCYSMCVNTKMGFPTTEYSIFSLSFIWSPVFSGFWLQFSFILYKKKLIKRTLNTNSFKVFHQKSTTTASAWSLIICISCWMKQDREWIPKYQRLIFCSSGNECFQLFSKDITIYIFLMVFFLFWCAGLKWFFI